MNVHLVVCANQLFHITIVVESVALRLKVTLLSRMSFGQLLAKVESPLWKRFILFNYTLVLCVFFRRRS